MKKIVLLTLIASTFALAGAEKKTMLMSAEECRSAFPENSSCIAEEMFLRDQNGRCGCLKNDEYRPRSFCRRARFRCDQENGYTYSRLTGYRNEEIGCGCYKTSE